METILRMKKKRTGKMEADILVGGQAVIEGVMMRTPRAVAVAVRQPDGGIAVMKERAPRWTDRFPVLKWPIVRGTAILIQSLILGIRALNWSAEVAMAAEADDKDEAAAGKAEEAATPARPKENRWLLIGSLVFSLAAGVALFVLVPYWLSVLITQAAFPAAAHQDVVHENWLFFNLVDGAIRVVFFLVYILAISLMKDIRRVFQYHGAEHKVVHVWEAKEPIAVASARLMSTLHPRCGTSFLLYVMAVSIVVFTVFKFDWWVLKVASRVVLLPLVAGISYELIRLSARFPGNPFCRVLIAPGLLLQRITTKPPDDGMLEVSVRALQEALGLEDEIQAETGGKPTAA
jgi:uncharacterized protein YqhQ